MVDDEIKIKKNQIWKSKLRGIHIKIISQSVEKGMGRRKWNIRQDSGKIHNISELAIKKQFLLLQ